MMHKRTASLVQIRARFLLLETLMRKRTGLRERVAVWLDARRRRLTARVSLPRSFSRLCTALTRREFVGRAGAALGGVAIGPGLLAVQRPRSASSRGAGGSFRELPVHYRDPNGMLDVDMTMETHEFVVGLRTLRMAAYNGSLPGPILRMRQGDTLRILLHNKMERLGVPTNGQLPRGFTAAGDDGAASLEGHQIFTNLHTHGFQVSPQDPGDNVLLMVQPGESHQYEYEVPGPGLGPDRPPQPAGLHWYHPHFHGSTTHQGWQGLSGPLIVEGDIDEVPAVKAATERVLVLNELWVGDDGTVPTAVVVPNAGLSPFTSIPAVPTEMLFTINGVLQPEITIERGETQRWRVLAAGPHRFFWLKIDGHVLYQIGQDGVPFAEAKPRDSIMMAPGNRAEFIIKGASDVPDGVRFKVRALAYDQGHPGGPRPERLLGTLTYAGQAERDGELPTTLVTPYDISSRPIVRTRRLTFQGDISRAPVTFTIDNQAFCAERIDQDPTAGTAEEWLLVNEDVFQHPFHIHVNPFQVVDVIGAPPDDPTWDYDPDTWWDVFRLPAGGSVRIRMYFRPDFPGLTVYHCHILPHEDNGMMGTVCISGPGAPCTPTPNPPCDA